MSFSSRLVPALLVSMIACNAETPGSPLTPGRDVTAAASRIVAGGQGTIVVFHSARVGAAKIYAMAADGSGQRQLTTGAGADMWPDLSPDGRHLAFASNRTGDNEIYVLDLATGELENVSLSGSDDNWPRWSPNGRQIAFHSNRDGNYNLWVVNRDGSGLRRVTTATVLDQWPEWSPNGKRLAFRRGTDIYVVDVEGEEQNVRQLTTDPALDQMAVWSPNGRELAFMSLRAGYPSVWLMSADGDTPEHPAVNLTPKNAGDANAAWLSRAPAWSRNGQMIYFMSFRPSTSGDVEIFVMRADGSDVRRLTTSAGDDGGPQVR